PGESLQQLLARTGPLPPAQVVDLAIDLCEALCAAHEVDVIHGDVKPGNVMLAPDRGAVLTDFGIARALSDPHADEPASAGTIFYTAPELLRGAPPSPATDLYALGVLLFEALTGATPWSGGDTLQAVADKLGGHPLDPRALGPALGDDWRPLLAACLDPRPEARPRDAGALLTRVHALRRGAALPHREPPAPPLGSGPGLRWLNVRRFTSPDPALQHKCAWISADLVQALRRVHALRVVHDGPGPEHGPVVQLHGELHRLPDGLRVVVRIAADLDLPPDRELVLHEPREHLPGVGVELATRVLGVLGLGDLQPHPTRPELLPAAAVEPYLRARDALLEMRTADAIRHFEAALAAAPDHPALRVGHIMARGRHVVLFRSPSAAEFSELRALIEAVILECSPSPE
ncbi:MAG: serine/threonine protein kinase, partial [Myxococcales bacterium]|nr:serine/threonine protein kinase [Myxococcales bacterium]